MLIDGHATRFNIDVWESKMVKKLSANVNHYLTEALCMIYVDNCVDEEVYKYLAARSRIGAWKPFTTVEKMFEVLHKTYDNVNRAYTAMNKFRDLKMTKDFNSFWAEFQVLASKLDHDEATLISELKYKLTPSLSRAMVGGVFWPTNIHEYAKQCQQTYQDLKNIKIQTPIANFAENQYNHKTNANTSTNTNANAKTVNCSKRLANSSYSCSSSMVLNPVVTTCPACSKVTRLTKEEIAKLQRKDWCFHCKKIGDHWPQCPKEWQSMTVFINSAALAWVNVSKMAVPQFGHIEVENKWPPQKLLWVVRNYCWSLPLVYQAICLLMRP